MGVDDFKNAHKKLVCSSSHSLASHAGACSPNQVRLALRGNEITTL